MFNLFKKNNKELLAKEKALMSAVFLALGEEYSYIANQLSDNIISGINESNVPFPNYKKFSLNSNVLSKYENRYGRYFVIQGIKIFDFNTKEYVELKINIGFGLLLGYATPGIKMFNPDLTNIDLGGLSLRFFAEEDTTKVKLFTKEEWSLLNPNEVYEVEINGKKYFHILDLEDGDFIGIDEKRNIYKITHDPFLITPINKRIIEILK